MTTTHPLNESLVTQECLTCGITFGITATVERHLRKTQRSFNCPNGHGQTYVGVTEAEKLRAEVADLQAQLARQIHLKEEERARSYERAQHLERQNASLRGVITRLKAARRA